ncbi:amino acid permease [Candidatus Bathyarchaeota archaeon]|nr:amino acid permease [Candidatus Bathyarchaeota archaeon]
MGRASSLRVCFQGALDRRAKIANRVLAATILANTGSVGLALIYWVIGFIMAVAGFSVYLEFASYFPNRSGSEVVYLEQAYPRPKHLFPVAFAVQSVILSFSSSNAIGEPLLLVHA